MKILRQRFEYLSVFIIFFLLHLTVLEAQIVKVVADTDGGIKKAGVELWDSYPDGRILQKIKSDKNGVFNLPDVSYDFDLRVYADWHYPVVIHNSQIPDTIFLEKTPVLVNSMQYMELWSKESYFLGYPVQAGDVISVFDPDGVLCGVVNVQYWESENANGFNITVFGDFAGREGVDEGAVDGDTIYFQINKQDAVIRKGNPVWHNMDSRRIELNYPGILTLKTAVLPDPSYGSIKVTPDNEAIPFGVKVELEAVPSFGYKFLNWGNAELDTAIHQSFVIQHDTLITAVFAEMSALPLHVTNQYPGSGFKHVPVNVPVSLDIIDEMYGVDSSSVGMTLNGETVVSSGLVLKPGNACFIRIEDGYRIKLFPEHVFTPNTENIITVYAKSSRPVNPRVINESYKFLSGSATLDNSSSYAVMPNSEIRPAYYPLGIIFKDDENPVDSIKIWHAEDIPQLPDTLKSVTNPVCFSPFGYSSQSDMNIVFHYSDSLLSSYAVHNPDQVFLLNFLPKTGKWSILKNRQNNFVDSTVVFQIDTLSYLIITAYRPAVENLPDEKNVIYNYPNPFNPEESSTIIRYKLSSDSQVDIRITDVAGNVVKIIERDKNCIKDLVYTCHWNGKDNQGNVVANNIYYCIITGSNINAVIRKIAVLR